MPRAAMAKCGFCQPIKLLLLVFGLSACSESYVVLLEQEDGSVGQVQITTPQGTTVLEHNRDALDMDADAGQIYTVSDQQIIEDFGPALAASPSRPLSFYLYFEEGTAILTLESSQEIPLIIAAINRHIAADISIVGHTDTVGNDQANARLGLGRANSVAAMFRQAIPGFDKITVESHGEMNLLIATPDNTSEPKNRRVEVTVR